MVLNCLKDRTRGSRWTGLWNTAARQSTVLQRIATVDASRHYDRRAARATSRRRCSRWGRRGRAAAANRTC